MSICVWSVLYGKSNIRNIVAKWGNIMKCGSCHAKNYDDAKFCWKCKRCLDESGNQFDDNASFLDKADLVASMELVKESRKRLYRTSVWVPLIEGIIFAVMVLNYVISADFSGDPYETLISYLAFALLTAFAILVNFALAFLIFRVCNKFNNRFYILWLLLIQKFVFNSCFMFFNYVSETDHITHIFEFVVGGLVLLLCAFISYRKEQKLLEQLDSEINEICS